MMKLKKPVSSAGHSGGGRHGRTCLISSITGAAVALAGDTAHCTGAGGGGGGGGGAVIFEAAATGPTTGDAKDTGVDAGIALNDTPAEGASVFVVAVVVVAGTAGDAAAAAVGGPP
eukprot:1095391-Amphidinium_carterae.1